MLKACPPHQSAPHRRPGAAQPGVLAEGGVHEATDHTESGTGHLEEAEDEHALLVKNEIPVSVHSHDAAVV